MSETTEAALIVLLNEHESLGNGKARELLGLDEAAYESLKAELLAKGRIATGRGRGGSIKLAEPNTVSLRAHPDVSLRAQSRSDLRPTKSAPEPKAKSQMPTAAQTTVSLRASAKRHSAGRAASEESRSDTTTLAQDEQAFLNELDKKLWTAADRLRSSLDAAVYKHAVLGLIFLKYVSDSFEMRQQEVERELRDPKSDLYLDPTEYGSGGRSSAGPYEEAIHAELEERDYYTAKNVFWVPAMARWKTLQDNAKVPSGTEITVVNGKKEVYKFTSLGKFIDDALDAVEKENPKLKGVLNKTYAQLQIEQSNLSSLIDLIATIPFNHGTLHAKDILGHVYEYFLGQFALAEGKKGGQYYTPKSIVSLIVRMLQPYKGRIYDPAMGSGGFFVQSEEFIEAFGGKLGDISVYGQESNPTTWRLAAMNMAIRGIDFNFGKEPANSFTNDQHPALRADFVMANPPFNVKEWWDAKLEGDPRWQYGTPPQGNANFAWVQHMLHHLAPKGSMALLLSNGSMSSNSGGEGDIRKALLEADLVECMVALPGQLFTNTQIPACIWFLTKDKKAKPSPPAPLPRGEGGVRDYRGGFDFAGLVERARELRKKQTPAEETMWETLRNNQFMGLKFRRQHQYGNYILDFYCHKAQLAIELDGPPHSEEARKKHDHKRDAYLTSMGLTVLRFPNSQWAEDPIGVLKKIEQAIAHSSSPVGEAGRGLRDRTNEVLFIDARNLGYMKDRVLRDFTAEDIARITGTFHNWKRQPPSPEGEGRGEGYQDQPGFCKSATLEEIAKHDHVLTPGRYVGAEEADDDTEEFALKMAGLIEHLNEQFNESDRLKGVIKSNLTAFGYEA